MDHQLAQGEHKVWRACPGHGAVLDIPACQAFLNYLLGKQAKPSLCVLTYTALFPWAFCLGEEPGPLSQISI